MLSRALFPALAFCFAATCAQAHPHVWIDMRSTINFDAKGAVEAIGVTWTFDEFYSQFATDGIDKNKNGAFDPAELQALANTYAKNLKEYGYFMFIEVGGKLADTAAPTSAKATFAKGQLTFTFRLPLAKPADPAAAKFSYSSFDPTYYIDIAPSSGQSIAFTGPKPKDCTAAIRKVDTTNATTFSLARSVKMIRPTTEALNATNAAVVDVTCAPSIKSSKAQ
jgi:ABC-type uncharacterized transport system substrate-binding protein